MRPGPPEHGEGSPGVGLERGAGRVVVFGGGTGISPVLGGLKHFTDDLVAIVTVADDGGSSGRLRKDFHMVPPGDIRNCLVAMSMGDPLLGELFSYRFDDSILKGHSFGNLFLAVLTRLTGDFQTAVERARHLLGVQGRVIPSTDMRVVLVATHPDGTRSTGEQKISRCGIKIIGLALRPRPDPVSAEIRGLLAGADLIVLGPGSLFTSLIPNLLVPGMLDAIRASKAPVVLVANLMTQPGETDGFDLADHVHALRHVGGLDRIDWIVANAGSVPDDVREQYRMAGADLLTCPQGDAHIGTTPVVAADVAALTRTSKIRHDAARLSAVLLKLMGDPRRASSR